MLLTNNCKNSLFVIYVFLAERRMWVGICKDSYSSIADNKFPNPLKTPLYSFSQSISTYYYNTLIFNEYSAH